MDAHEYLKEISPNDKYGVREKLQKNNLKGIVENIMEKYAQHKIEKLHSEVHKITGDGEVMACFNYLLGINAS